ncbi:N-terminal Xaa-Pro-Lys N-methyltransferase 1-like [Maniola hyperantus]|uniref:N-terminal Xaa-Pro-Lys N-methyltransferase 1-like n=1 Tax=Aphantopus hyperantus TaxID=2795564 RepID=UPI001568BC3B|nr:N-terminal Xaa-Pro-Lys N-methyltransferase 1-like [Maniola hyperantus]
MTDNVFYKNAAKYWANIPATIDGVLGGYGHITDVDIDGSKLFLNQILLSHNNDPPGTNLALDCGAGIGRVSKNLLMPYFQKVDLVEQDGKFINTAKKLIGANNAKLGTLYQIALQDFKPQKEYDVIWCQWVLGHLDDYDLISFLERCSKALAKNGVIVIKENMASSEEIEYDEVDSSVARPRKLMELIFKEANLRVIKSDLQNGFPEDIYSVHMIALVPNK